MDIQKDKVNISFPEGETRAYPRGVTVAQVLNAAREGDERGIVAAWVNDRPVDLSCLIAEDAEVIKNLEVAEIILKTKKPILVKDFNDIQELGRFVIVQDENICAGGIITQV